MISVVMPAYNAEEFIVESIESILNQTYKNFEFIIVNDGSTDNTASIIDRYAQQDARIKIIHKENGGISRALNAGIEVAQYPWIARMDADDISLPHRLARQLEVTESMPEVVVWGNYAHLINVKGDKRGTVKFLPTSIEEYHELRRLGKPVRVIHSTALFKRDIALKVNGYDPRLDGVEDSDMWWRMSRFGPVVNLPEYFILVRIHESSVTAQKEFVHGESARRHAFIGARYKAWTEGVELTYDMFCEQYAKRSLWTRIKQRQYNLSYYYWRVFATQVSAQRYLVSLRFLVLSFFNNPFYVIGKVKDRLVNS